ncbi:MAG: YbdD/YjiX family protein [Gemmatimonadaceae bacterium]
MSAWLVRVAATLRRIIGAPDYAAYLAHHRACHPGRAPMDEATFVADRLTARYERPGSRCC